MISKFSIKKPFTVFVMVILIIVFGFVAYTKMTPDLFPSIDLPYVVVVTSYGGATPEEVEVNVTKPLEQQMSTLSNLKEVQSVSAENYSAIILEFNSDANLDTISVDIRDKVDLVSGQWNERVGKPVVLKLNPDMMPMTVAAVSMEGSDNIETSDLLEREVLRLLEGTDGVASVTTSGLVENTIHVALSDEKIEAVNQRIQQAIIDQFGEAYGTISSGISDAESQAQSLDDASAEIVRAQEELSRQFDGIRLMLIMNSLDLTAQIAQNPDQAEALAPQLQAVGEALADLNNQKDVAYAKLGNTMAEITTAKAMLQMTLVQLESSLAEVESSQQAALDAANLTGVLDMSTISAIIAAQNLDMPAGYAVDGDRDVMVSVGDKIQNKKELEELVIFDPGIEGLDPITLSDVADVTEFNNAGEMYAKIDGTDGVLLSFQKQSDYATTLVAGNIQDKFAQLEEKYPGLTFTTLSDQGQYIYMVIDSVLENLLIGAVLAILILLFFLRDFRPTLITALSIPISLTFAIVLMYFSGVSLNVISLAGLAVGVGMLVDNSIIVIENIFRLRNLGLSRVKAAISGVTQMSGAITASTLTTVCVFLPLVFVEGITKQIFTDMALTVTYSLMASLIVALTLVPAMGRFLLTKTNSRSVLGHESPTLQKYRQMVNFALRHKAWVLVAAVLMLSLSLGLSLVKGFEYMPSMASPEISATLRLPEENTLEETSATGDAIQQELSGMEGVESVSMMLASDSSMLMGIAGASATTSELSVYILLDENQVNQGDTVKQRIKELAEEYGGEATVFGGADITDSAALGGGGVSMNIYSDDLDNLRETAALIEKNLAGMDGLEDISDSTKDSVPELRITVDKNAAMEKGLTVAQIYAQVAAFLTEEQTATTIQIDDNNRDVVVAGSGLGYKSVKEIKGLELTATDSMTGETSRVILSQVADFSQDQSLSSITHVAQKRALQVSAAISDGYNVTLVNGDVQTMIDGMDLPPGTTVELTGENQAIMDAMTQLMQMLALGFLMIYLVMVAQFQSLLAPFIVIFSVPLAFTGGLLGLLLTGQEISVVSMIGFVMLMGVVVNNAIVLIDTMNRFRMEGMEKHEAIIQAGATRLRPVLMTSITTVLALLPMAFGFGTGAELIQPVAIVCVGGLLYATFMTLLVIPAMYDLLSRKKISVISDEELTVEDL